MRGAVGVVKASGAGVSSIAPDRARGCATVTIFGRIWSWLANPDNRNVLGFLGGALAAVAVGGWQVYVHFHSRPAPAASSITIKCGNGGVVSGHDTVINNNYGGAGPTPDPRSVEAFRKSQEEAWKTTTRKLDEVNRLIGGAAIPAPAAAPTAGTGPR